ncbi:MAG: hypothetical protein IPG61_14120 [bacterium]|nr:hypothetical protein [bacterium]
MKNRVGRPSVRLFSGKVSSSSTGRMTIIMALNSSGSRSTPAHQRGCERSRLNPGRIHVASSRARVVTPQTSR